MIELFEVFSEMVLQDLVVSQEINRINPLCHEFDLLFFFYRLEFHTNKGCHQNESRRDDYHHYAQGR
jgi:hypothetical protein